MHHPEEEEEYDYESLGANTTMLQNAFAGALAGIAEHCAMYPVDSIKVSERDIFGREGGTIIYVSTLY